MPETFPPSDESSPFRDSSPPPAPERKPAWWCWPLIVFSLIPLGWLLSLAPPVDNGGGEVEEVTALDQSDLALLKMQGQIVIATAKLNPDASIDALDDLAGMAADDRSIAALALLESFIAPESPRAGETLTRLSETVAPDLAAVTKEAVSDGVSAEGREDLRTHLGWFADLARDPGLAPPPLDQEIRTRAFVVLGTMGLLVMAGSLGLVAGAVLLILYLRHVKIGRAVNAFDPARKPVGIMLECFALYLGIMTVGSLASVYWHSSLSLISYGAAVVIPLLWPTFRGVVWHDFSAAAGLHRGKGWWREIGAGVVGYPGVLAIASIGIFLTLILTLLGGQLEGTSDLAGGDAPVGPETHPIVGWIYGGSIWTRLACLFLASGFAPLFEELFFRGALQRYFRGRFRFFPSALLTGVIFAALHPQGFYAIPALAGIGIGFSLLREWRDSLIAPMVAHAINNGVLVGVLWWVL